MKGDNMADVSVEELEGCVCEYIPENLRTRIQVLADAYGAYTSQVVSLALDIGLAVMLGKNHKLVQGISTAKYGEMKQSRRGKLSGKGV